jgi:GTP cyclohydrolase II
MTIASEPLAPGHADGPAAIPDRDTLKMRVVQRAASELKRGLPVLIEGRAPLVVLAAETAGAVGLADMAALGAETGVLLLAPVRAAAALRRPIELNGLAPGEAVALRLRAPLITPDVLRAYADPTVEQVLPPAPEQAPVPLLAPAALALAKLARLLPAVLAAPAVPYAVARAEERGLLTVSAEAVLSYPTQAAAELRRVAEAEIPLDGAADARVIAFRAPDSGVEHLAIVIGRPEAAHPDGLAPLARIHSECFTGDLLGSLRCDCGPQLRGAIRRMAAEGRGVLLYLAQEGRGIGLVNKLRAYALQDGGLDTVDANCALGWGADERNFVIAATMLRELGIHDVRLLTNNPDKVAALVACGVPVRERVSHDFGPNGINDRYLRTKAARFGHLLT